MRLPNLAALFEEAKSNLAPFCFVLNFVCGIMKKNILFLVALVGYIASSPSLLGQTIGINTLTPNTNAALDIQNKTGSNQGLLIPRLPAAVKATFGLGAADKGMIFYGSNTDSIYYWTGTKWLTLATASAPVASIWSKTSGMVHLSTLNDNVGMGVSAGSAKLELRGIDATPTNLALRITNSSAATLMTVSNVGDIAFNTLVGPGTVVASANGSLSVKKGNSVTGKGLTNKITFWGTADSLFYNTNLHWDNVNSRLGIGTSLPTQGFSVAEKFTVNSTTGSVNFADPLGNIQFPAVTTVGVPMINMFASNTTNADRMVIAHSPSYTDWGLQYQDASDQFNFISGGTPVMTVSLASNNVGIGTSTPATKLDVNGQIRISGGTPGLGKVLTSDATGLASWQNAVAFSAYSNANQTLTSGSSAIVSFNVEDVDNSASFNIATYTFTAPSNGTYFLTASITMNAGVDERYAIRLTKNGTIDLTNNVFQSSYNSTIMGTTNTIVNLIAGDNVAVECAAVNTTASRSTYHSGFSQNSRFAGYRLF